MKSSKPSMSQGSQARISQSSSTSAENSPLSRKWITISTRSSTHSLNVIEETGKQCLNQLQGKPCNLIAVFGSARQGKSFLLNCLSGRSSLFKISNSKDPCTQGVDISNVFMPITEFAGRSPDRRVTSTDVQVGFVDVEGQGDRDVNYDAKLICPILLVSKCIIFNWMDSLQKNKILELLGIMQKAARNVSSSSSSSSKTFGCHLHIVFRDWSFANSDSESVKRDIFQPERDDDPGTLIRNHIRQVIEDSFESIHIWLFPHPTNATSQLRQEGLDWSQCNNEFKSAVVQLRGELVSELSAPSSIGNGRIVDGPALHSLVSTYVNTLNRNEVIVPESAFVQMIINEARLCFNQYKEVAATSKLQLIEQLSARQCAYNDTVMPAREVMEVGLVQLLSAVTRVLGSRVDDIKAISDEAIQCKRDFEADVEASYLSHVDGHIKKAKQTVKAYIDKCVSTEERGCDVNCKEAMRLFISKLRSHASSIISLLPFPEDHDLIREAEEYITTYIDSKIHLLQARVIEGELKLKQNIIDRYQQTRDAMRIAAETCVSRWVEKDIVDLNVIRTKAMRELDDCIAGYRSFATQTSPTDSDSDVWQKCRELTAYVSELIDSIVVKNYSIQFNNELNAQLSEANIFIEESFEAVKDTGNIADFDALVLEIIQRVWDGLNRWDATSNGANAHERVESSLTRYASSLKGTLVEKNKRHESEARMRKEMDKQHNDHEDDLIQSAIKKSRIATKAAHIALLLHERQQQDDDDQEEEEEEEEVKKRPSRAKKETTKKKKKTKSSKMDVETASQSSSSSVEMPAAKPVAKPTRSAAAVTKSKAKPKLSKKGLTPTEYAIQMAGQRWKEDDDDDVVPPPAADKDEDDEEDDDIVNEIGLSPPKSDVIAKAKWDGRRAQIMRTRQVVAHLEEEEEEEVPKKRKRNQINSNDDDDDDATTTSAIRRSTLALPASKRAGSNLLKKARK